MERQKFNILKSITIISCYINNVGKVLVNIKIQGNILMALRICNKLQYISG